MHQIADACVKDNGVTEPIRALAGLGGGGKFPNNCGRDFARFVANRLKFPGMVLPYELDIPIIKLDKMGLDYKHAYVLLPHEIFSALYAQWPEQIFKIFNVKDVPEFWARESRHRTPPPRRTQTIPLRAWGDDASHCKTAAFLLLSWCSCTAFNLSATLSRLMFGALDLKQCDLPSFEKFYSVFMWSMEQLFLGKHPSHNHDGIAWADLGDTVREQRAGSPLAGGWRAVLYEYTGDWKWLHESLQIPWYYNVMQICWGCKAENNSGPLCMTDFTQAGPCNNPAAQRPFHEYRTHHHGRLPALARAWHFTLTTFLRIDWMHVGPLGCCSRVAGSCLISLVTEHRFGHFTGKWEVRINNALRAAYRLFTKWCNQNKLRHSHVCFTAAQLSCSESCHQYPDLYHCAPMACRLLQIRRALRRGKVAIGLGLGIGISAHHLQHQRTNSHRSADSRCQTSR